MYKLRGFEPRILDKKVPDFDTYSFNQKIRGGTDELLNAMFASLIDDLRRYNTKLNDIDISGDYDLDEYEKITRWYNSTEGKIKAIIRETSTRKNELAMAFKNEAPDAKAARVVIERDDGDDDQYIVKNPNLKKTPTVEEVIDTFLDAGITFCVNGVQYNG